MTNDKKIKTLCIIGCGGFIGSHLVGRFLSREGYKIYGMDIDDRKISQFLGHERFSYQHININEYEKIRPLIEKSDCVISLVALCNPSLYNTIPLSVIDVNLTHSLEIIKQCVELKKWVMHFSTCEVYGMTLSRFLKLDEAKQDPDYFLLKEDDTPLILGPIHAQRWIYACAKELLERIIYAYNFEKELEYTIIRPFNFVGPRMDYIPGIDGEGTPRVLACFISDLLFHRPLRLVNGGMSTRAITYIDDAVDAIELMIQKPDKAKGQIFNVGNPNNEVTIKELAHAMIKTYKKINPADNFEFLTQDVTGKDFYGEGYMDSDRRTGDFSKAQNLLGYQPKADLETTLDKTIRYYLQYYKPKIS